MRLLNQSLSIIESNKYLSLYITFCVVFYSSLTNVNFPLVFKQIFRNIFFKIAILLLIYKLTKTDEQLAIMAFLAFLMTNSYFKNLEMFNDVRNYDDEEDKFYKEFLKPKRKYLNDRERIKEGFVNSSKELVLDDYYGARFNKLYKLIKDREELSLLKENMDKDKVSFNNLNNNYHSNLLEGKIYKKEVNHNELNILKSLGFIVEVNEDKATVNVNDKYINFILNSSISNYKDTLNSYFDDMIFEDRKNKEKYEKERGELLDLIENI